MLTVMSDSEPSSLQHHGHPGAPPEAATSPKTSRTVEPAHETSVIVTGIADTRDGGPKLGGERAVLDAWLRDYRLNALLKIDGLTAQQLAMRPIPPSALSLLGIIRHLTEVEMYWLREVLHGEELEDLYSTPEHPDGDFDLGSAGSAALDVDCYRRETARCAELAAAWIDLDGSVRGRRGGAELNLRWILTHLIEEYARHLGHMDLLREAIDGTTGY